MALFALFALFLSLVSVFADVSVISIERPSKVSHRCAEVAVLVDRIDDPLVKELLECVEPVRQCDLETNFKEAVGPNGTDIDRVREIARRELIDWKTFERSHLNVSTEFPNYDSFLLVEDVAPFCKPDLVIRICFTINPTRVFGTPEKFDYPDATSYQIKVSDYFISSVNCTIHGESGRCYREFWPWIWRRSEDVVTNSEEPPTDVVLVSAGIVLLILLLVALLVVLWKWKCQKKRDDVPPNVQTPELVPNWRSALITELPFIDSDFRDSCIIEI